MSTDVGLTLDPWFLAEPRDDLLRRAAGEIAPDRIILPIVTGPLNRVRRFGNSPGQRFATSGGWHFSPDLRRYDSTRIRPRVAAWCRSRDILPRLLERIGASAPRCIFRVDVNAAAASLDSNAVARRRSAWGDERRDLPACACNPDLRELLRCTLDDLTRFEPAGFEIAGFDTDPPRDPPDHRWNSDAESLLDLCFCESCRQTAAAGGVNADSAARSVQVEFARSLDPESPGKASLLDEPAIAAYLHARRCDCAAWLQRLVDRFDRYAFFVFDPSIPSFRGRQSPAEPNVIARARFGSPRRPSWDAFPSDASHAADLAGWALPVGRSHFADGAEFVRVVSLCFTLGVRLLDFEDLYESPVDALTWLRQALRYARRQEIAPSR